MLTGLIGFEGKTCVFKLNKEHYTLEIEEIDERDELPFQSLAFLFDKQSKKVSANEQTLVGIDFEKGQTIHFHTRFIQRNAPMTFTANLHSYIVFIGNESSFDGLQIQADELNWFYNIGLAFEDYKYFENGEVQLQIKPFDKTTEEFEFNFNNSLVKGNLSINRGIKTASTRPLELYSNLNYHFGNTADVSFVKGLVSLTRQLLQFLSYRKNLHINRVVLKKKLGKDDQYYATGYLFINHHQPVEKEEEKVIKERIISYPLIDSSFSTLLEKLSEKKVYLTHIPDTSILNRTITPARIIMATAGFEWQIRFSHKAQSEKSEEKYKEQKKEILDFLEEKIIRNSGKEKKFFKEAKKLLLRNDTSLANKIEWAFYELDEVLNIFIKSIYRLNGVESNDYEYKKIAERIQHMRNDIAHGNIDKETNQFVSLDFLVLEWLYYAMVLKDIGVSNEKAQKCINDLFKCGFNL